MAISGTTSRYDAILLHRQRQRDAADIRDARSEARREMANQTLAKSSQLRNSVSNLVAQSATDQSQLIARLIRTRMNIEAAQKAAPSKWYR